MNDEEVQPSSRAAWRKWLALHHGRQDGVWVAHPKKQSGLVGPNYSDLVEEALCFGWIDGQVRSRPGTGWTVTRFSPRRPGSIWAKSNRDRVARLIRDGSMTEAGLAVVERAKQDGSWTLLARVESEELDEDVAAALRKSKGALQAFRALPASARQQHLYAIYSAKREATRRQRIERLLSALL